VGWQAAVVPAEEITLTAPSSTCQPAGLVSIAPTAAAGLFCGALYRRASAYEGVTTRFIEGELGLNSSAGRQRQGGQDLAACHGRHKGRHAGAPSSPLGCSIQIDSFTMGDGWSVQTDGYFAAGRPAENHGAPRDR
jgi:hypothetical protein